MQRKLVAAILLTPTAFAWLLAAIGMVAHRAGVAAGTIVILFIVFWLVSCATAARSADRQLPRPDPAEAPADERPHHQLRHLIAASILINSIGALLSLLMMGVLSG